MFTHAVGSKNLQENVLRNVPSSHGSKGVKSHPLNSPIELPPMEEPDEALCVSITTQVICLFQHKLIK